MRKNRNRAKGAVDTAIDECINNISTTNYANLSLHERDAVWKTAMQQLTEKFNYLLPSKKRGQEQEQQQPPPLVAEP